MINQKKRFVFCLDTLIATSDQYDVSSVPIKLEIEYLDQKFLHIIDYISDKTPKSLKIIDHFENKTKEPNDIIKVNASVEDIVLIQETINPERNIIGAIKSTNYCSLSVLFRIITDDIFDIEIYGVQRYQFSDFKVSRNLDRGSFSQCFEMTNLDKSYIIKRMREMMNIRDRHDKSIRELIPLILFPKYPNILGLEGYIMNKNHGIILVHEFLPNYLRSIDFGQIDKSIKYKILYGLLSCISFLHENKIIHCDIHPSNVLVSDDYTIKLTNFFVSCFINDRKTIDVGHTGYIAPEVQTSSNYNELADEYSLGILLTCIEKDDFVFKFCTELLTKENYSKRISCSEILTLIESGFFDFVLDEEEFSPYISEYHKTIPLLESTIDQMIIFFKRYDEYQNQYCDLIKLAINVGLTSYSELFNAIIKYGEAVAMDVECLCVYDATNMRKVSRISKYKINLMNVIFNVENGEKTTKWLLFSRFLSDELLQMDEFELSNRFSRYLSEAKNFQSIIKEIEFFFKFIKTINKPEMFEIFAKSALKHYISYNNIVMIAFEHLASLGNIDAYEHLAIGYIKNKNFEKGKEYAEIAIKNKKYGCTELLANVYDTEGNYSKAFEYYKISAKMENTESMYKVGLYYLEGKHGVKDDNKGSKYIIKSAQEGNSTAQYYLAVMYFRGIILKVNYANAFKYNELSIEQGNQTGMFMRGLFYFYGLFVNQNVTRAAEIFEQIKEQPKAALYLATIHLFGLCGTVDIEKANEYFKMTRGGSSTDDTKFLCVVEYDPSQKMYHVINEKIDYYFGWNDLLNAQILQLKQQDLSQITWHR